MAGNFMNIGGKALRKNGPEITLKNYGWEMNP